jgi:hypothetical protein
MKLKFEIRADHRLCYRALCDLDRDSKRSEAPVTRKFLPKRALNTTDHAGRKSGVRKKMLAATPRPRSKPSQANPWIMRFPWAIAGGRGECKAALLAKAMRRRLLPHPFIQQRIIN